MGVSSDQASNSGSSIHILPSPNSSPPSPTKPQQNPPDKKLNCPRCHSTNTKFCYYNNYNKLQPRHFCKSCRRYWTDGGTLRNVPIGGSRKNKRPKAAATTTTYQMDFQAHNPKKEQSTFTTTTTHDDHKLQFPSPRLPCSVSGSGYVSDLYGGQSSGLEETAMDGVDLSSLDDQPWTYMESSVDFSWVWDGIDDKFLCSDDVSLTWDDVEIN